MDNKFSQYSLRHKSFSLFFSVSNALCTLGIGHTSGVLTLGSGGRKEGARTIGTRELGRRWPLSLPPREASRAVDSGVWSSQGPGLPLRAPVPKPGLAALLAPRSRFPGQSPHGPTQNSPQSGKGRAEGEGHVSVKDPLLSPCLSLCVSFPAPSAAGSLRLRLHKSSRFWKKKRG